jgi:DNA-binding NarL/FixJ family response regulator
LTTVAQVMPQRRARILVVDDHSAVREVLARRLNAQPDLEVCGLAADVNDALRLIADTHPDAAVIDLFLKTGSGLDLLQQAKTLAPGLRTLVWSMHGEAYYVQRALQAGALGFLHKDQDADKIIDAVRCILRGEVWVSAELAPRLGTEPL